MQARPRLHYPVPRYPTRLQIEMDPRLLAALPPAWRARPELVRLAGFVLTANLVAGGSNARAEGPAPGPSARSGSFAAVVAPVFDHGTGRGAVGCVVVSPPVFLSEEEAQQVIAEELATRGVVTRAGKSPLPDVRIPTRSRSECDDKDADKKTYEYPNDAEPLDLAVWDASKRVAASVVVDSNRLAMGAPRNGRDRRGQLCGSTVRALDFKEPASYVREQVKRQGRSVYFGVFYDPLTPSKKISRELLRAQVKDFVDWLTGQGVI